MYALIEQWMGTTHTFHLPFGDITITPLDFTAITGLSFSGEAVPFSGEAYSSLVVRNRWTKDLFRIVALMKSGCSYLARHIEFIFGVISKYDIGDVSSEQLARCFLFYLLSVIIFLNASRTSFLQLLPVLKYLKKLPKYS